MPKFKETIKPSIAGVGQRTAVAAIQAISPTRIRVPGRLAGRAIFHRRVSRDDFERQRRSRTFLGRAGFTPAQKRHESVPWYWLRIQSANQPGGQSIL